MQQAQERLASSAGDLNLEQATTSLEKGESPAQGVQETSEAGGVTPRQA